MAWEDEPVTTYKNPGAGPGITNAMYRDGWRTEGMYRPGSGSQLLLQGAGIRNKNTGEFRAYDPDYIKRGWQLQNTIGEATSKGDFLGISPGSLKAIGGVLSIFLPPAGAAVSALAASREQVANEEEKKAVADLNADWTAQLAAKTGAAAQAASAAALAAQTTGAATTMDAQDKQSAAPASGGPAAQAPTPAATSTAAGETILWLVVGTALWWWFGRKG